MPHPFGFAAEAPSRIEKSTFRNFIDRKSDAFRAKLASPFQDKSSHVRNQAGGYSAHQQSANAFAYSNGSQAPESYVDPPRSASGYPTGSAFDGPQWQDFKPTAHDQAQALPKPQNSVRSYEHSRRKAADFDFGDAMRSVKQYEGSGKPPQGWNRLQKVTVIPDPVLHSDLTDGK